MKSLFLQIMKFGFVGGTAFVLDYFIMILLTEVFSVNYLISCAISFCIAVLYNYVLSVKWVFTVNGNLSLQKNFLTFMMLSVIGLGINQILMWVSVEKLKIFYMLAKVIATGIVMIYNFITRKVFLEYRA